LHGALTLRAVLLFGALALPYLLLLELPFRLGIARWRAQRLSDLAARRGDLDSQVRRLATQPASDEVLQAMQYDLVLLQFYRGQVQEAQAVTTAPYGLRGRLFALALAVAAAFALDGLGDLVLRTLMRH
jgi:hypothetical protein